MSTNGDGPAHLEARPAENFKTPLVAEIAQRLASVRFTTGKTRFSGLTASPCYRSADVDECIKSLWQQLSDLDDLFCAQARELRSAREASPSGFSTTSNGATATSNGTAAPPAPTEPKTSDELSEAMLEVVRMRKQVLDEARAQADQIVASARTEAEEVARKAQEAHEEIEALSQDVLRLNSESEKMRGEVETMRERTVTFLRNSVAYFEEAQILGVNGSSPQAIGPSQPAEHAAPTGSQRS